jgi:hypothetical protein
MNLGGSSLAQTQARYSRLGEACHGKIDKVNAELLTLTYGALVADLVRSHDSVDEVNKKLDEMGHSIGLRLIDEFLAKSGIPRCGSFRETAEVVARVGFRMFLNVTPDVRAWNESGTSCVLALEDNPLEDFVELPKSAAGLRYCSLLCGVLRGALESVNLAVECQIVSDALVGDPRTEISLTLKHVIEDATNADYHDE